MESETQRVSIRRPVGDDGGPVNMTLYEMTSEAGVGPYSPFQVDTIAWLEGS